MRFVLLLFVLVSIAAHGQWEIQSSGTTASLRGIANVGNGVAWASGTGGTVLHTEDGGKHWLACAVPSDAAKLDFRGVQAFDAKTAIVMSSGKGDLSRLYKTTDGCATWKLVFMNPDKDGFWDAIRFSSERLVGKRSGTLVGDPVNGSFSLFLSDNGGEDWHRWVKGSDAHGTHCKAGRNIAKDGEALFAASNGSLAEFFGINFVFVTGGTNSRLTYVNGGDADGMLPCRVRLSSVSLPLANGASAGAFALAPKEPLSYFPIEAMIVGGDYTKPDETVGNAIFVSTKRGANLPGQSLFKVAVPSTPPHGYRSAVAYDAVTKTWVTVGPNGTDISTDDGRNWRALTPSADDALDADKNWNALSLPFVVGPKGRIGVLRVGALKTTR